MREPAPFVTRCPSRTVANGDSITLLVRRCVQCSAGKSKNVSSAAASFSRVVTGFGHFGPYSPANCCTASRACLAGLGVRHLVERGLHAGLEPLREFVEKVAELVKPVPLLTGLRPHVAHGSPGAERTVAHSDDRRAHGPTLQATAGSIEQAMVRFERSARRTCPGPYVLGQPQVMQQGFHATVLGAASSDMTLQATLTCR